MQTFLIITEVRVRDLDELVNAARLRAVTVDGLTPTAAARCITTAPGALVMLGMPEALPGCEQTTMIRHDQRSNRPALTVLPTPRPVLALVPPPGPLPARLAAWTDLSDSEGGEL